MTVTLPADLQAFVDEQVEFGAASDAATFMIQIVRLVKEKTDDVLRAALVEGEADIAAGRVIHGPFNARQMLEEIRQDRRVAAGAVTPTLVLVDGQRVE